MPYQDLLKNSFVIALIIFLILCMIFYLFKIGYKITIDDDGDVKESFSWKYPLAITLIAWLILYFFVMPPKQSTNTQHKQVTSNPAIRSINYQKINLDNWN